jgi:RNA polymerase sigma-70 factor (ECF subfamily)
MHKVPDATLINLLSNDNGVIFNTLYFRYVNKLRAFLARLGLDRHADDIIQETFITIWRKRNTLDASKSLEAYIFTIAKNLALKSLESELKMAVTNFHNLDIIGFEEDGPIYTEEFFKALDACINRLPPRPKQILHLKRFKGLSTEEIALELGLTKSTVENHMNRAMTLLREELAGFSTISLLLLELFLST